IPPARSGSAKRPRAGLPKPQSSREVSATSPFPRLAPPRGIHSARMDALGSSTAAWEAFAENRGLPRYRGRQIFDALHRRGRFDFAAMRELPAPLREELAAEMPIR